MPGPGTLDYVAEVARNVAAKPFLSAEWQKLSELMCWDAVGHCIELGGFPKIPAGQTRSHHVLVRPADTVVQNAAGMAAVPAGHAIGFFTQSQDAWIMIHAMLSVGQGQAAGNKNACIGIGGPIGWEVIDLRPLNWQAGFFLRGSERIYVHHRAVSAIG